MWEKKNVMREVYIPQVLSAKVSSLPQLFKLVCLKLIFNLFTNSL